MQACNAELNLCLRLRRSLQEQYASLSMLQIEPAIYVSSDSFLSVASREVVVCPSKEALAVLNFDDVTINGTQRPKSQTAGASH